MKSTKELLAESYATNDVKQFKIKDIRNEADYNPRGELEKYEGSYFIYDPETKTPIKFKVNLRKEKDTYILRGDLNYFVYTYFSSPFRFVISQFELVIEEKNSGGNGFWAVV